MKSRIIPLIAILLTAGAITVVVAWGCALWIDPTQLVREPRGFAQWESTTADVVTGYRARYRARGIEVRTETRFLRTGRATRTWDGRGWPYPAFAIEYGDATGTWRTRGALSTRLAPWPQTSEGTLAVLERSIPLRPVWAGLAADVAVYGAALVILAAGLGLARRVVRRRRKLCERCGYPIGASERCSECGASVTLASAPTTPRPRG